MASRLAMGLSGRDGASSIAPDENIFEVSQPGNWLNLDCLSVRVGSYKVIPKYTISITEKGVRIKVPAILNNTEIVTITIPMNDVLKVLAHFGKSMPILFLYISPAACMRARESLAMINRQSFFIDVASHDETQRRVTLLPQKLTDDDKMMLKQFFSKTLQEVMSKEANEVLVRSSPKYDYRMRQLFSNTPQEVESKEANEILVRRSSEEDNTVNDNIIMRMMKRPRSVDPVRANTPKVAKNRDQDGDDLLVSQPKSNVNVLSHKEVKNASPQPSTSTTTSQDKVGTMDQKLQEQVQLNDSEQIEDDQKVENLRTNVRKQYIELIETTNSKLNTKQQDLKLNRISRGGLKKNLKERQGIEMSKVDKKFHQEVTELEQEMEEQEKQLAGTKKRLAETKEKMGKEREEIHKKHQDETTALDMKLEKNEEHDKNAVAKLKDQTNKLATDLRNLVQDPTNDEANLEAARATLECPICMELMKPPTKIWMCSSCHIVCEPCKDKLKGKWCPTCRTERVTMRALMAENFARTVFL